MTISASVLYYDLKLSMSMRENDNLSKCILLTFPSVGLIGLHSYSSSTLSSRFSVLTVINLKCTYCLYLCPCSTLWYANWQEISGSQKGPQTNTLCWGFGGHWLLRKGLGARFRGSAKKVSGPTSASCSSPSESTLPVWKVRERDTGQFQESAVVISTESKGGQEPIC